MSIVIYAHTKAEDGTQLERVGKLHDQLHIFIAIHFPGGQDACPSIYSTRFTGCLDMDLLEAFMNTAKSKTNIDPNMRKLITVVDPVLAAAKEWGKPIAFYHLRDDGGDAHWSQVPMYTPPAEEVTLYETVMTALHGFGAYFETSERDDTLYIEWVNDHEMNNPVELDEVESALRGKGLYIDQSWTRDKRHWQRCNIIVTA